MHINHNQTPMKPPLTYNSNLSQSVIEAPPSSPLRYKAANLDKLKLLADLLKKDDGQLRMLGLASPPIHKHLRQIESQFSTV